ncbi:hypothetical protein [Sphaerisporangium corydalis]|uniref:RNA-binding protein n=1 Tax=Sphaerisporangium corydalis TaxID=1441875 RepID=A0ABV9EI56_9ACTN|nr:hypothetical protein [Sphaerisporangium corydalis]
MRTIHAIYVVTPGSIWADQRALGRTVLVTATDTQHATCLTLTNSDDVQRVVDYPAYGNPRDMRGTTCRIRLDRFRPTSNGFAFVTANGAHLTALLTTTP